MNNPANWRVVDLMPGAALAEIERVDLRARALFARNMQHPVLQNQFLRLHGVLDIIAALEYHFRNIQRIEETLPQCANPARPVLPTAAEANSVSDARHEATAYVAALGRFYYFARTTTATFPTIERLLVFRHKAAAHRSSDMPKKGESVDLQSLHALCLASAGGQVYTPLPNDRYALSYQIQWELGTTESFTPDSDHGAVMAEAYSVLESLFR